MNPLRLWRVLVPAPLLSLALLAVWLALSGANGAGDAALGLLLALLVPHAAGRLRLSELRVRRPLVVVRFILTVGYDVLRSNLEVAWGVIVWRWRPPVPRFVTVPLDMRDPVALAALAMVVTVVPGTVWSELALDRSALLLHVWDVAEGEEAVIAHIKDRYEAPLREIFE